MGMSGSTNEKNDIDESNGERKRTDIIKADVEA